jgi:hypothetical protein
MHAMWFLCEVSVREQGIQGKQGIF